MFHLRDLGHIVMSPPCEFLIIARSHPAWSKYVKVKIEPIFHAIRDQMEGHKKRDYDAAKSDLESMSNTLRKEILNSTAATLDDHAQSASG